MNKQEYRIYILFTFSLFLLCSCKQYIKRSNNIVICGDDCVMILENDSSNQNKYNKRWEWKVSEAALQIPKSHQKWMTPLDECKLVDNQTKLLLTSSGGGVLLLNVETKKCLFYAHVPMAHSADLLPNNKVAVALSTHNLGNSIEVFDIRHPETVLFRDSLYSAHGVAWIDKRNILYVLGYDVLKAYKIVDNRETSFKMSLEKSWNLPSLGGHDLSIVNNEEILISTHEHVYIFNIQKEEFSFFKPLANSKNVKSVNWDKANDILVYTKAEINWWTHNVYIKQKHFSHTISIDSIDLYKARYYHP